VSAQPTGVARVGEEESRPVSIVQERILSIERELPGLPQFNLPFAYRLRGPLNTSALEVSLVAIARRHESLRTGFVWRNEFPAALVTPADNIKSCLTFKDLAVRSSTGNLEVKRLLVRMAELEAEQECLKPIDVTHGPLFRARLFRLGLDDHVLLLVVHDVSIDGWSMKVFVEELSELYAASVTGRQAHFPKPVFQFSDFAHYQRQWSTSRAADRQFAYWKECLQNASPLFGDVGVANEVTARVTQKRFHISKDLLARLADLSRSRGATLFMTLLAGFKTLLLLRTGHNDICVSTMMANRSHVSTQRVIGPLANTTLIRTRIDADLTFYETVNRVRRAVLDAYARQELPFDIVAARLAEEGNVDLLSLVRCHFVLQVAFRRPIKLRDVVIQPFGYREGQSMVMPITRTWLRVALKERPSGIIGTCQYKADLFELKPAQRWVDDYKAILNKAAANPNESLGSLLTVER
jgi:hypothetical protein